MVRIDWNDYIQEQLHWAERLAELACDKTIGDDSRMLCLAKRAMENAKAAHQAQLSGTC